ncbi:MAG: methyltransferase [Clostridiaceae bacterium]|nr:methyltransferase [Clostridiaceae bacterium]
MNSIERFLRTIERKPVDRPACWLGVPHPHSVPALLEHFGAAGLHELKLAIGDDIYTIDIPYESPNASAIYAAFDWYQDGNVDAVDRTLTAPGFFCHSEDPDDVNKFDWPDPARYIDVEQCKRLAEQAPKDKAILGMIWSAHFQDTCAAFGMDKALINMLINPEMVEAVNDRILKFYLKANEIFFEATKGKLHAVIIGNDIGSQRGLMISPNLVRRFVIPGAKMLTEQAHSYGLKVIYHSCGSIAEIIPDLFEAGVDAIHPVQALAEGMNLENIKKKFGDMGAFCGAIDTQELLVKGTAEEIRKQVQKARELFPTGLIISPSHEAILPDIPPANIQVLFEEATRQ